MDDMIGSPENQLDAWQLQDFSDNCAVTAQMSIINQYLVDDIGLDDANYVALAGGWWSPGGGTQPEDVGRLMDAFGIDNHAVDQASIESLAGELQAGHRVIVGVNSGELWDQGPLADFANWLRDVFGLDEAEFSPADHAVSVTGIDLSNPDAPMVIINDPGTPDGAGATYPLDKFMDAWQNSDFYYVATNEPPPMWGGLDFDIGTFLGFGSAVAADALGLPPDLSVAAGNLVSEMSDSVDWDSILRSI